MANTPKENILSEKDIGYDLKRMNIPKPSPHYKTYITGLCSIQTIKEVVRQRLTRHYYQRVTKRGVPSLDRYGDLLGFLCNWHIDHETVEHQVHTHIEILHVAQTRQECLTKMKEIVPYWAEMQLIHPGLAAVMMHFLRSVLIVLRETCSGEIRPVPSDWLGILDWLNDLERYLHKQESGGGSAEQPWIDDDPDYMANSEAVIDFTGSKMSLSALSKLLKKGHIRYMRQGKQRCKVHIGDFRRYTRPRYMPDVMLNEAVDKIMDGRQALKEEIKSRKNRTGNA